MMRTTRRAWRTLRDWGPATAYELAVRVGMRSDRHDARRVMRPLIRTGSVERIGSHRARAVYQATPLPPLTARQLDMLLWMEAYGPDTASAYALDVGVSEAHAEALASDLIDTGLLRRREHLRLTRAGLDAVEHVARRRRAP